MKPLSRSWPLIALVLILLCTAALRWRLAAMPLERDEGEFAYAAQLMLKGEPPYLGAYNKKFPGVSMAYALIMTAFGQTATAIRLGTLLVNAAAIVLLFLLTRRLWSPGAAVVAAATYAILSSDQGSLGMAGHSEHFVVLAALAGMLALLEALRRDRLWLVLLSGVLFGVAVLMKQSGVVFVAFGGLWILIDRWPAGAARWRRVIAMQAALAAGAVLPLALLVAFLWRAGVLGRFWFWTVVYAGEYGAQVRAVDVPSVLGEGLREVARGSYPLWILAAVAGMVAWRDRAIRTPNAFALTLLILSFVGASFGFLYRDHYFILVMPAVAMFAGAGVVALRARLDRSLAAVPAVAFCLACAWVIVGEREFLLSMSPDEASRATYGTNPFVESPAIARYLAAHTRPDDTIAVLGSEAQILFYARRPSATGYIYTYGLMQPHPQALRMQREMAAEIEAARPRYLVLVAVPTSWGVLRESERWIFDWFTSYAKDFEPVGLVELFPAGAQFRWDDAARRADSRSPHYLTVLKRKTAS